MYAVPGGTFWPEFAYLQVFLLPVAWPVSHPGEVAEAVREFHEDGFPGFEAGEVVSSCLALVLGELHDEVGDGPVELVEQVLVCGVAVLQDVVEYPRGDDLFIICDVQEDAIDLNRVREELGAPCSSLWSLYLSLAYLRALSTILPNAVLPCYNR